nr:uncharacterized protein LOC109147752 [Ipomoea batatas]
MDVNPTVVFSAWDKLWKLPVPPKVKNFLWRCARNIVPVREVLKQRHVWIGGGCPLCDNMEETTEHLFCSCTFAYQVWGENDVAQGKSMPEFMQSVLSSADGNYAVRMAAVCWVLWLVRNAIVWQNEVRTVDSVCMQVQRLQLIWKDAYTKTNLSVNNNIPTAWTPPQHGFLKCNVDAAIFDDGVGYGAVLRDHHGLFVAAKADRLMATCDPLLAEALAVKEALSWIIETDCLNFVLAFHSRSADFSYIRDKKGAENLVADHLSMLITSEKPSPLQDDFPDEHLFSIQKTIPWYADIVNYLVTRTLPPDLSKSQKDKIKSDAKYYVWDDPYLWKHCSDQIIRRGRIRWAPRLRSTARLRDGYYVTHVEEDGQGRRDERGDVVWLRCLASSVARRSWGERKKAIALPSRRGWETGVPSSLVVLAAAAVALHYLAGDLCYCCRQWVETRGKRSRALSPP